MVLNKIIYGFMWLEVILVAILVAPTRLGIARLLSRVLSVHNPKAFYNRYGSSVVGAIIFLIVLVVYSIVDAYRLLQTMTDARGHPYPHTDIARFYKTQRDLYLFGSALFLLYVLVGVCRLWRDVTANEQRR